MYNDSDTSDGASTMSLNPVAWEQPSGYDIQEIEILHGANAYQESYFDSRPRKLVWEGIYASASYDNTGFISQFGTMQGWKGSIMYFNFKSMDDMNDGWPTADTWKKARIVDLRVSYAPASRSGIPLFERVELVIQPEQ